MDGGLLSATAWRKQYSTWVSQCLQIVQLLVKDYAAVQLKDGDYVFSNRELERFFLTSNLFSIFSNCSKIIF